jgi:hypothetical protein
MISSGSDFTMAAVSSPALNGSARETVAPIASSAGAFSALRMRAIASCPLSIRRGTRK